MAAEVRKTTEARVIERAPKDEAFRQQLVDDPHGASQQELGVSLPGTVNIEVLEETPGTKYLVLPPAESARLFFHGPPERISWSPQRPR